MKSPKHLTGAKISYAEIRKNGTQVSTLGQQSPHELLSLVSELMFKAYKANPVGMKPDGETMTSIAEGLIEEYWYLKIEEFPLVFKNGRRGKYGKQYNQFGEAMVFDWFAQYSAEDKHSQYTEQKAAKFKEQEHRGRNLSVLEMPKFKEKILELLAESAEPEKDYTERIEYLKKQAEQVIRHHGNGDE